MSLISSNTIGFYFNKYLSDNLHISPHQIRTLPIKKIPLEQQRPFIDLVDLIIGITKNEDYLERDDLQKQVKVLESRIDDMVYKLYELTPEEIEIIEGGVNK